MYDPHLIPHLGDTNPAQTPPVQRRLATQRVEVTVTTSSIVTSQTSAHTSQRSMQTPEKTQAAATAAQEQQTQVRDKTLDVTRKCI